MAHDVFVKIPGTPSYFRNMKFETFARNEQYGPFTFFITLSAAEMKWTDVTTSILRTLQSQLIKDDVVKIVYEDGWEFDEDKIMVCKEGWDAEPEEDMTEEEIKDFNEKLKALKIPVQEYKKKFGGSKFYKDHYMLITRIFDNRVKAFIKHILMANADIIHYSYRIEFQVRGLPHLHGIFWLNQNEIRKYSKGARQLWKLDKNTKQLINLAGVETSTDKWELPPVGSAGHVKNITTGKCLSVSLDAGVEKIVEESSCDDNPKQIWQIEESDVEILDDNQSGGVKTLDEKDGADVQTSDDKESDDEEPTEPKKPKRPHSPRGYIL